MQGYRRFGGFKPIPWKTKGNWLQDLEAKTFLFSLDCKKIYYLKNGYYSAVYHNKESGPIFGGGFDIGLIGNPLKENTFYTLQTSYEYNGNENPLSEYQSPNKLKVLEYEVFQIIFD